MAANIALALIQQPASSLFGCLTLTSASISLPLSLESLLFFLPFFSSAQRLCSRPFRASRRSCSLSWRCSFVSQKSTIRLCLLLLKTVLSRAPVRFWSFLVHSIYSGTLLSLTNSKKEIVLAKVKDVWHQSRSQSLLTSCGACSTTTKAQERIGSDSLQIAELFYCITFQITNQVHLRVGPFQSLRFHRACAVKVSRHCQRHWFVIEACACA